MLDLKQDKFLSNSGGASNTNPSENMRLTSSGYVHMAGASDVRLTLGSQGTAGNNDANWVRGNGTSLSYNAASANHIWETGGAEKMRLDSSGNLLVGKTSASFTTAGLELRNGGPAIFGRDQAEPLILNRLTTDGGIVNFNKDGDPVGSIGTNSGDLVIYSTASGHEGLLFGNGAIVPVDNAGSTTDDACNLGGATGRFSDFYLAGKINPSAETSL